MVKVFRQAALFGDSCGGGTDDRSITTGWSPVNRRMACIE